MMRIRWHAILGGASLVLSALAARPAQADSTETAATRALQNVHAWQIESAHREVEALFRSAPSHPLTLALMAELKFHRSDYEGAVHYFQRAQEAGVPGELLFDRQAAEAARVATQGYMEQRTPGFLLRYPPGRDEILVPYALDTLGAAKKAIGDLFGWRPQDAVVVELYPSASTLAKVSSLTEEDIQNSGTIALCRWNRLMVTSPRAIVFGYSWRDTIAHELTHLIIGTVSKNTVPIWLHEGLAKYAETAWRAEPGLGLDPAQARALIEAAKNDELISFDRMHPSMAKLKTQQEASLAFAEVFSFIEHLIQKRGWPGIRSLLAQLAAGAEMDAALTAVYGKGLDALALPWIAALKKRPLPKATAAQRKLVVKKAGQGEDDPLHGVDGEGRRFARAADLLYRRGRLVAAKKELEKAAAVTDSPLISAKLATIALATGDMATAERAARKALAGEMDMAGPAVTLAQVLVQRDKHAEAREVLERALDINPFDPRIHQLLVLIHNRTGNTAGERLARRAVAKLDQRRSPRPSLGRGGLIRIEGERFGWVYLRPVDGDAFIATGRMTPTAPFALKPGAYELLLRYPDGTESRGEVTVKPHDLGAQPQAVRATS